jgi:hypothetical protein
MLSGLKSRANKAYYLPLRPPELPGREPLDPPEDLLGARLTPELPDDLCGLGLEYRCPPELPDDRW